MAKCCERTSARALRRPPRSAASATRQVLAVALALAFATGAGPLRPHHSLATSPGWRAAGAGIANASAASASAARERATRRAPAAVAEADGRPLPAQMPTRPPRRVPHANAKIGDADASERGDGGPAAERVATLARSLSAARRSFSAAAPIAVSTARLHIASKASRTRGQPVTG